MIRPFRRRPLIPQLPDETWSIGDIAGCVAARHQWREGGHRAPAKGSRSIVIGVERGEAYGRYEIIGLHLAGFPYRWDARGFRKIVLADSAADRFVEKRQPEPAL